MAMARSQRDSVDMGLVYALAIASGGNRETVVQTLHTMEVAGIRTLQHIRCDERWNDFIEISPQPQLHLAAQVRNEVRALEKMDFYTNTRLRGKPRPPPTPRSESTASAPEPERVEAVPPPPPLYPEGWWQLFFPDGTSETPLDDGDDNAHQGRSPSTQQNTRPGTTHPGEDIPEVTGLGQPSHGQEDNNHQGYSQDLAMLWEYMVRRVLQSYRCILCKRAEAMQTGGGTSLQWLLQTEAPMDLVPIGAPMPQRRPGANEDFRWPQGVQPMLCAEYYFRGHCTLGETRCPWRHMRRDLLAENY